MRVYGSLNIIEGGLDSYELESLTINYFEVDMSLYPTSANTPEDYILVIEVEN